MLTSFDFGQESPLIIMRFGTKHGKFSLQTPNDFRCVAFRYLFKFGESHRCSWRLTDAHGRSRALAYESTHGILSHKLVDLPERL